MSGRHSFKELTKGFSPERRRRIDETKKELLAEYFILPVDVLASTPERLAVEKMLLLFLRVPPRIKSS